MKILITDLNKLEENGFVLRVFWVAEGLSHGQPIYFNGVTQLLAEDESPVLNPGFIPFENLTEAQVLDWVKTRDGDEINVTFDKMGLEAKAARDAFFNGRTPESIVSAQPPWLELGPQPEDGQEPA